MITFSSIKDAKILIVGPGAFGGYLAARFGQKYPHLYVYDHKESRALLLGEQGFHVTGKTVIDWMPPANRVGAGFRFWPKMDAVFFCVRSSGLRKAFADVKKWLTPRTLLVSFAAAGWREKLPFGAWQKQQVGAVTREAVVADRPGRIVHAAAGLTFIDKKAAGAPTILEIFHGAQLAARLESQFDKILWADAMLWACIGPLSGVADVPLGRLMEPQWAGVVGRLADEAAALSKAAGQSLTRAQIGAEISDVLVEAAGAVSTFRQDILSGRETERKAVLEPLVALAKKKKSAAPLLTFLNNLIKRLESRNGGKARAA